MSNNERHCDRRPLLGRVGRSIPTVSIALAAGAMLLTSQPLAQPTSAATANSVVHWNDIASATITADAARGTPSAASLYVAIVQAAVYDAVMAVEGTHEPYAFDGDAPGASLDAAVAAAAHDVLVTYFPARQSSLDAAYAASLDEIDDGAAKWAGVQVGQDAAATLVALRVGDGRDAVVPVVESTEPGAWRRTSSGNPVTPYVGQVRPFLAESPEQFRAPGPVPLSSHRYAVEFERTRLYGAKVGSLRTPEHDEIATFWTENTLRQYQRALRVLATQRALTTADTARLFAMTALTGADAMITCWNTKYHFSAWRPVTAIHNADADGNDLTTADPTWQPLSVTALHPEYTSGHACLTGAVTRSLREFLGTKQIDFTMTSTAVPGATHHFATVDDLRTEVEDARVYGGDHWESGGTDGTVIGERLAKWALKEAFAERATRPQP